MKKLLFTLMALLFFFLQLSAQEKTISGKVTDEKDGTPLAGVSISVPGTNIGTVSAADGTFTLKVPANTKTLEFSSVNHALQTVPLTKATELNVAMTTQERAISEIVVVGFGVQKKKSVTSAIGKINPKPIADLVTPSIDRQLGGRTAGLQVTTTSGLVNEAPRIRIRGVNSINGARSPLIVLDGIPIVDGGFSSIASTNALADINPADVESIEVLKDGSATAIYGSRAANGVLMITTKKGRSGRSNVNYSAVFGFSNPQKKFKLLNAEEFVTIANEKLINDGQTAQAFLNSEKTNTDWQSEIFNDNAASQIHNLSIDGGSDKTSYFFSLNYANQDGMVITNKVKRYALRANLQHKVNNWLTITNNLTISRTEDNDQNNASNGTSGTIGAAIRSLPNVRVKDPALTQFGGYNILEDGSALGQDANLRPIENNYSNIAFILAYNKHNSTKHRILNNLAFDIKPVSWLTFTSKLGTDYYTGLDFQSWDSRHGDGRPVGGYVFNQNLNNLRWVWQNYINANKTFDKHGLGLTLGTEVQKETFNSFNGQGSGVSDLFFIQRNLITGSYVTQYSGGNYAEGPGFLSYFARANYDYDNKYFLQLTFRRDGLSKFAPDYRFGNFPGVSAGWRISGEDFWKNIKALEFINDAKIRASWAKVGNDQIAGGLFPYLSQYGAAPYGAINGIAVSVLGNPGLTWETNEKLDFGIDLALLKNKLNFTFDWFQNKNNGLVLAAPLPVSFGVPGNSIYRNIGDMQNTGIELGLSGNIITNKDFSWDVNLNYTNVKNEVKSLYLDQDVINGYNILKVGQPINALYGYQYAGVNSGNGNPMYYTASGSLIQGDIESTSYYEVVKPGDPTLGNETTLADEDRRILGSTVPTWYAGFSNSFRYKGFTLDMLWRFSGGNKIFNVTKQDGLMTQYFLNNGKDILKRWQKPGDITDVPKLWYGRDDFTNLLNNTNSRFVESGNYARLDNIQLSYNVKVDKNKLGIKSLRVFVQGQNLLLFTNYSGIDPENITEEGIDNSTVPKPTIFSFGFNLGL
ncbi:MAG TPA: TonB-dependent receptor [Chitinophagaceae bacterium]|nr:TonB-dependent receptor [Chitinophagaceae bacterium]